MNCQNNNLIKYSACIKKITIAYIVTFVVYYSIYLCLPFRVFLNNFHLSSVSHFFPIFGSFIIIANIITNKEFFKNKNFFLLLSILSLLLLSSLINFRYDFVNNIKVLIFQAVQMFILFYMCSFYEYKNWDKLWNFVFLIISIFLSVTNIYSFVQFFTKTGYIWKDEVFTRTRQGFLEGRLFGLYTSPHYSSVLMIILMLFAFYLLIKTKKIYFKILYGFFICQYFLMATLSRARSVRVSLSFALFLLCFIVLIFKLRKNKLKMPLKILICITSSVVVCFVTFFSFILTDKICTNLITNEDESITTAVQMEIKDYQMLNSSLSSKNKIDINSNNLIKNTAGPILKNSENNNTTRDDVDISNISNNRFKIWKDYFYVIFDSPITAIFGASPGGYMKYISKNYNNLYIVQEIKAHYPNMVKQGLIYDTHNAYISVMISGGILTSILMLIFLVSLVVRGIKCLFLKQELSYKLLLELTILAFILASSFFDTDLFFKCTATSAIFWVVSGFIYKNINMSM